MSKRRDALPKTQTAWQRFSILTEVHPSTSPFLHRALQPLLSHLLSREPLGNQAADVLKKGIGQAILACSTSVFSVPIDVSELYALLYVLIPVLMLKLTLTSRLVHYQD